jgi:glucosamine--fructose-6-phosphate aminotransferase (isomerizing)
MLQGKLKTPARYDLLWQRLGLNRENIIRLKSIHLIAAGSSWHAALIAQFFFESIAKISTYVHLASEFQDVPNLHMSTLHSTHSLYILVSQSGETADTLESLRIINNADLYTLVLTNVASSSMVREARYFLPLQAGPEISVASTKAFSTQTAALYWLANRLAFERNAITLEMIQESDEDLVIVTEVLESLIEFYKFRIIQELAPFYAQFDKFVFLGRHICYPFAMEAALKLREISYIFAMAFSAGELKHGSIALIDSQVPIVLFSSCDSLIYKKLLSNAQEVKARKGHLLVFAFEGQNELIHLADEAFIIPKVKPLLAPLAMTGLMQFFIYQVTQVLGRPIDKPRNLAKCVTVE